MVRLFIALPIPEDVRSELAGPREKLGLRGVKVVNPDQIHITLKFLGETPDDKVKSIMQILDQLDSRPFEIELVSLGAFPSVGSARVVWAGVEEGKDDSVALAAQVENLMAELGFKRESRPFTPHVTLARVKSPTPQNRNAIRNVVEEFKNHQFGRWRADRIVLMQSKLTRTGPIYTRLAEKIL